ncbi:MAG: D-2-hydroxyacid dehydrogenase [Candidatus Devosia phytovorans]|uniref:D-2-hydroxyacid dehydrogenase n=1 Tax=Candidatus Devosia phytovorans TaxID=3121372 RepID=A0AAJ6AYP4_9HYPH|nr:D-2-hydroxyacid dehydrogenase [Devosia sp.]WEK02946.1 MAG: D-2-hydroxyacid dehydrogenase [Devosia sp.]
MHVHIQNRPRDHFVPLTAELVHEATKGSAHRFTISDDDDGFAQAALTMEVLVTTSDQVLARFPSPAPSLKAVFLKHAGVDALIDVNPLPAGIMLLNNSGAHAEKAGQYVLMAALMLQNGLPIYLGQQHDRIWLPHFSGTLSGKRVSILGVGGLGSAAAKALSPYSVHLTGIRSQPRPHSAFDRILPFEALDDALPQTDILVLAAPLTALTRHVMNARRLALLPPHAGIINISRGELIEEAALIETLNRRGLAGAILDVTATEPPAPDDPLWTCPNLVLTPHVSATDMGTYARQTIRILLENLEDMTAGRPARNRVDLVRGY